MLGEEAVDNPRWLAPEILDPSCVDAGLPPIHKAADVYSFGIILWEVLTMSPPWAGWHNFQVRATRCMFACLYAGVVTMGQGSGSTRHAGL